MIENQVFNYVYGNYLFNFGPSVGGRRGEGVQGFVGLFGVLGGEQGMGVRGLCVVRGILGVLGNAERLGCA